jgi:hypothetical protein
MARRKRRRQLAGVMTWAVAALQGAVLLTFAVDPSDPPQAQGLFQLLWAAAHRPSFYPLVGLLVAGPVLTGLAWCVRGPHRPWLIASWAAFLPLAILWHAHRLNVMLRILWQQM